MPLLAGSIRGIGSFLFPVPQHHCRLWTPIATRVDHRPRPSYACGGREVRHDQGRPAADAAPGRSRQFQDGPDGVERLGDAREST